MRDSLTNNEILIVRNKGKRLYNKYFTVYVAEAKKSGIAVVTPKKLGGAVQRNRIKRRIREAYRSIVNNLKPKRACVFYPKFVAITTNFDGLSSSIATALSPRLNSVGRS